MLSHVPGFGVLSSWGLEGEGAACPWVTGALATAPSGRGDSVRRAGAVQKDSGLIGRGESLPAMDLTAAVLVLKTD